MTDSTTNTVLASLFIALLIYILTSLYTSAISRAQIHHELKLNKYDKLHYIIGKMISQYRFLLEIIKKIEKKDSIKDQVEYLHSIVSMIKQDSAFSWMDDDFLNVLVVTNSEDQVIKKEYLHLGIVNIINQFGRLFDKYQRDAMIQLSAIKLLTSYYNIEKRAYKLINEFLSENLDFVMEFCDIKSISDSRFKNTKLLKQKYSKLRNDMQLDLQYDLSFRRLFNIHIKRDVLFLIVCILFTILGFLLGLLI